MFGCGSQAEGRLPQLQMLTANCPENWNPAIGWMLTVQHDLVSTAWQGSQVDGCHPLKQTVMVHCPEPQPFALGPVESAEAAAAASTNLEHSSWTGVLQQPVAEVPVCASEGHHHLMCQSLEASRQYLVKGGQLSLFGNGCWALCPLTLLADCRLGRFQQGERRGWMRLKSLAANQQPVALSWLQLEAARPLQMLQG